ncbi:aminotransferase class I/II-fold pyridoxal phosphate-dependent enzyme [Micromonospora sp. NPDC051925]|uniref:aminotransferase class I/II-fold pyridoxal phosphate-dependent enzyme n=1 Tax=Micromonospora sp. NPDC051925 TaxID=3364288 RepID=UPI0037C7B98A
MNPSGGWLRLQPKIEAIRHRLAALESDPSRKNSFVPYGVERDTPYVTVDDERYLMMSGYSYLGLSGDQRVVDAAKAAVEQYGTGAHGVRALAGSLPLHEELEAEVARFNGRPAGAVFGSGYAANVGTIGALCGPGDTVLIDKYDHASIVDGCKLSGATVTRFRHNDPEHLDLRLRNASPDGLRLVIVDSVYSMDGDIAPLPELRKVCDDHDALLMVDEAHALGVIGATGRGIEEHFGSDDLVDIKLGTLSKAIPSMGGWVVGPPQLIQHLRYNARPFLFSAALAPAQAGAALEALRILDKEPERVTHIQRQSARLRGILNEAGMRTLSSETAVIPLIAGSDESAYDYATACRRAGVIGLPVVSPAVPNTLARLRIAITARHSEADIDVAAEAFLTAARECRLIPA